MTITVDVMPNNVIYGAAGVVEVVQNIRTILTTRKGTVPLDREFGVSFTFLDDPLPSAIAQIQREVFEAVRKYEKRAVIKEISLDKDPLAGRLVPKVRIEVNL